MRALWLCAALAVASLAPLARADQPRPDEPGESAQREQSREEFRRGVAALRRQAWQEARDAFVHAYQLFPHPSILLDLGIARAHVGEYVDAEQDLTRFLAEDTGAHPDELQTARSTLGEVRTHLGTIRLRVAPAGAVATLDDKPVALVPHELVDVRVPLGGHKLHVEAVDRSSWDGTVIADGPEAKVVDLTLRSKEAPLVAHPGPHPRRIVSYVLFGVGAGLAGFGIFAGVHSIDLANQYNTPTEANYQNPGTKSEGIAYRTAADVTLTIAAVCAVTGIVLFATAPKSASAPAAQVSVGPTGFALSGRF